MVRLLLPSVDIRIGAPAGGGASGRPRRRLDDSGSDSDDDVPFVPKARRYHYRTIDYDESGRLVDRDMYLAEPPRKSLRRCACKYAAIALVLSLAAYIVLYGVGPVIAALTRVEESAEAAVVTLNHDRTDEDGGGEAGGSSASTAEEGRSSSCAAAGNGRCEPTSNTAECEWDGGDCCRETCAPPPPQDDETAAVVNCGMDGYECRDPTLCLPPYCPPPEGQAAVGGAGGRVCLPPSCACALADVACWLTLLGGTAVGMCMVVTLCAVVLGARADRREDEEDGDDEDEAVKKDERYPVEEERRPKRPRAAGGGRPRRAPARRNGDDSGRDDENRDDKPPAGSDDADAAASDPTARRAKEFARILGGG